MQVDFVGIEETIKAIEALPGLVGTQVYGDGMLAAAKVVRDQAKGRVPVKTGALQKSIRARKRSSRVAVSGGYRKTAGSAAQVVAGGAKANHAFIVEFGRAPGKGYPGEPPKPYLEPALHATKNEQLNAAGEAMKRSFAKIAVKITSGKASKRTLRLAAEDT